MFPSNVNKTIIVLHHSAITPSFWLRSYCSHHVFIMSKMFWKLYYKWDLYNDIVCQVNLTVDRAQTTQAFTQEQYSHLSLNDVFYVGGTHATSTLPGSPVKTNFVGCMRDVSNRSFCLIRNRSFCCTMYCGSTGVTRSVETELWRIDGFSSWMVPHECADLKHVKVTNRKPKRDSELHARWARTQCRIIMA